MMRGRFITFEGVDGCGKSTQLHLLADWLGGRLAGGLEVTREPGGTPLGAELRRLLLEARGEDAPVPEAELLLFLADRAQHARRMILPALADGRWVLCDRYSDSTMAYQLAARGLAQGDDARGETRIGDFLRFAECGARPDLTIWLDLPPDEAALRMRARADAGGERTRLDAEKAAFHRKVAQAFAGIAAREPERVARVDAGGGIAAVARRVRRVVAARFGLDAGE